MDLFDKIKLDNLYSTIKNAGGFITGWNYQSYVGEYWHLFNRTKIIIWIL